tara:strand:+ start:819 stop:1643 length:825 start_codon:yes stop_codon:yes gene_type:complete
MSTHVDGNNFISHYLKNGKPFCAGKIGGTELKLFFANLNRLDIPVDLKLEAENVSGLVPTNQETLKWFSEVFDKAVYDSDLLAKWSRIIPALEEKMIEESGAYSTPLQHLEPYFHNDPWSNYLEGKKVLVFSPFAKSIENNYKNFDKIWNGKIKSNFELKAITYPTSITITEDTAYGNYKEIYDKYIDIIQTEEFDVGIFGTGYTGLLFAAESKRQGKAGIHMGGSTQCLFGVLGNRWKANKDFDNIINEYWTPPTADETPQGVDKVEDACYWG